MRGGKIGAARIGDGGNAHPPPVRRQPRQPLEPFDAGFTERLGVGHDVRLRDGYELARAEIVANFDLMLDRPLRRWPALARPHRLLIGREIHACFTIVRA